MRHLIISGYGGASGDTAGIYDAKEQRFLWNSGVSSLSFMCGDGSVLFGAEEQDGYGNVHMFMPEGPGANETGAENPGGWWLADTLRIPGGALCHIDYSAARKLLTGACYQSGEVFLARIGNGRFEGLQSFIRQGGPDVLSRAHCAVFSRDGGHVYTANIALDRICDYEISERKDVLVEINYAQLDTGAGPRQILQVENTLYVITEYSNEIIWLEAGGGEEPMKVTGRVSTLPGGMPGPTEDMINPLRKLTSLGSEMAGPEVFEGESYGSSLCFFEKSPTNGFIYAANRGANTIAVFSRHPDGQLEKTADFPCQGDWPRHVAVVYIDERVCLAVANERSGRVTVLEINTTDGTLGEKRLEIPFEGASYVKEIGNPD